jgi:sugar-specific transcriptional regulator TrmB
MNIKQALKNYGLKDEETRMYLAGLEIGESPLAWIAKKAGIKRSSAYLVAKSLEEKGLMGGFRMRTGLKFVVTDPSVLLSQLNRKMIEITEIIPELKAVQRNAQERPRVTVYEGEEGYFSILEDSLKGNEKKIRSIGSLKRIYEIVTKNYDDEYYIPNRLKKKIMFKGLLFEKEAGHIFTLERNAKEMREVKFLPENYSHPSFIMIYGNSVAIFTSKKELIAVKIESEEIAQSEKNKFDFIWSLL